MKNSRKNLLKKRKHVSKKHHVARKHMSKKHHVARKHMSKKRHLSRKHLPKKHKTRKYKGGYGLGANPFPQHPGHGMLIIWVTIFYLTLMDKLPVVQILSSVKHNQNLK